MKVLSEYLVTVYNEDNTRLGAYTLYGESYSNVLSKVKERTNYGDWYNLEYKGKSVFEDWMLV